SPSQEAKWCSSGQRDMSSPTSLMSVCATPTSMPSIRVRSTPLMRCSSRPKSNCGAWLPAYRRRSGPARPSRGQGGGWLLPRSGRVGAPVGEAFQVILERLIAFRDALLVRVVHRDFLLEDEYEIRLPGSFGTFGDDVARGANAG